MNKTLYLFTILTIFSCDNQKEGYTIIGTTSGIADSTKVYLSKENEDFDSTLIIGDKFSFKGKVDSEFENIWIHTEGFKEYKSLWVVNNEITFDATNASFRNADVKGSRIQDQNNEYENLTASLEEKIDSIGSLFRSANEGDRGALRKVHDQFAKKKHELEIGFIRKHPDYELSVFFLTFLKNDIEKAVTKELYEGFTDKVKNTEWGKTISLHIDKSTNLEVGDEAIDFQLAKLDGEMVSLSALKGKYVLLEFWATWCGPCRKENPILRDAYQKFNDRGFEILGVSLDKKRAVWESTVKEDSITWITASDLTGMGGEVPITYSIEYIPKNYLLDKDGIVIAKDLRGEGLSEKLKELLGG